MSDILAATAVGSSQAYVRRAQVRAALAGLSRQAAQTGASDSDDAELRIAQAVIEFMARNPGCVVHRASKRSFSVGFRAKVRELRRRHPTVPEQRFAAAIRVRPSTLRAWLRATPETSSRGRSDRPRPHAAQTSTPSASLPPAGVSVAGPQAAGPEAALIDAWRRWRGSFTSFCDYVRAELGLPWRRTAIARLLADAGLRHLRPRGRRPRVDLAPRRAFQSFFPGAIWSSDGAAVPVVIDGQRHVFNVQLMLDTDSGAIPGISIRDHESGQALCEAFDDAVRATGETPLGLLLDHRPCNHGRVASALRRHTRVFFAGKNRPQSKGHVEGAFGLFSQAVPPIELRLDALAHAAASERDTRELARQVLALTVQTWARTWNYRPRRTRQRRHRVELYRRGVPSADAARRAERFLDGRVRAAGRTRRGPRPDSALRRLVRAELARLELADPRGYTATVLASRPLPAVLAGLAIFAGKRTAGTLPADAGHAYLLGIVGRLAETAEVLAVSDRLWETRSRANQHVRAALVDMEQRCRAARGGEGIRACVDQSIDHAVASAGNCDRRLWLAVAGKLIRSVPRDGWRALYRRASRRIAAHRAWSTREQHLAMCVLAAETLPLPL
ncbi:MAG: hypothetical protein Tsb0020_19590 [Haliangiales bacterium]